MLFKKIAKSFSPPIICRKNFLASKIWIWYIVNSLGCLSKNQIKQPLGAKKTNFEEMKRSGMSRTGQKHSDFDVSFAERLSSARLKITWVLEISMKCRKTLSLCLNKTQIGQTGGIGISCFARSLVNDLASFN